MNKRLFSNFIFGVLAVLCLAFVLVSAPSKTQAASYKTGVYKINTQDSDLNIRSGYGTDYMKVGSVPKGTKVTVTFVSSNGWGRIVYGDAHGWISLSYCTYVGSASTSTTASTNASYGLSASSLTWVTGLKQEYSKKSGLCTSSATGTLLRRRQAAEGKEVTFTFADTRTSCGGNPNPDSKGYYQSCTFYYSPAGGWVHTDAETGEKTVYYCVRDEKVTHMRNREYIADLLDKHPEGIVVYANYGSNGRHAIVISDYVRKSDGSIQFYAYDPANGTGRCKLEDTWMMTKFKSVGSYLSHIRAIWYIKGELIPDDSQFEFPEAQAYNRTLVATKKAFIYAEADDESEQIDKLSEGDIITVCYVYKDKSGTAWYITEEGLYIKATRFAVATEEDILAAELAALEAENAEEEALSENADVAEGETSEAAEGENSETKTEDEAVNADTEGENVSAETEENVPSEEVIASEPVEETAAEENVEP